MGETVRIKQHLHENLALDFFSVAQSNITSRNYLMKRRHTSVGCGGIREVNGFENEFSSLYTCVELKMNKNNEIKMKMKRIVWLVGWLG